MHVVSNVLTLGENLRQVSGAKDVPGIWGHSDLHDHNDDDDDDDDDDHLRVVAASSLVDLL